MSTSSSLVMSSSLSSSFAKKRLLKDWKELQHEQENLFTVAAMPTSNFYEWRATMKPDSGPYAGTVFHMALIFDDNYPRNPPKIKLFTSIAHPNVFDGWYGDDDIYICLDMLKQYSSSTPYEGWSAAYSVTSILLQLQSFLFGESIPQDYGGSRSAYDTSNYRVQDAIRNARNFTCNIDTCDGEKVVHTHAKPWPPLPMKPSDKGKQSRKMKGPQTLSKTSPSFLVRDVPISVLQSNIFGFLGPKDIIKVRNVCSAWRKVAISYNLFERSQLSCFYSKKTLDDAILGVGIIVEYHRNRSGLKSVTSQLDILSVEAFEEEGVCTSVFDKQQFEFLLPLVLDRQHSSKAQEYMERTIYEIMKFVPTPKWSNIQGKPVPALRLYPHMVLQLMSSLMNSMVVQLMNDVGGDFNGMSIRRHASEKALEGYCAFHHLLLHFGRIYPSILDMANKQVDDFIQFDDVRLKKKTPDLGSLLVCLTLSHKGWHSLWKPFLLEMFDRNVRWLLQKYPELSNTCGESERLMKTFDGTTTSLRLLMFQVYFMSQIGRPEGSTGPNDVLGAYDRRLGRPTTSQKEALQRECKHILDVQNWGEFFDRCKVPRPPRGKLLEMLRQAIKNSLDKGYHYTGGRNPTSGPHRQMGRGGGRRGPGRGRGGGRGGRGPRRY